MSLSLLIWLCLYAGLAILSFWRPAYGIGLYLLTFFLSPHYWWWGSPLIQSVGDRVNLFTALLFAAVALSHHLASGSRLTSLQRTILVLLLCYAINATLVHLFFAANPVRSLPSMLMIWKQVGLLYLILISIRDRRDLSIMIACLIAGAAYIGYEVVVNDRGRFTESRLEGVGAPGAAESNYLAALLALSLPLAGYLIIVGSNKVRIGVTLAVVMILEVILQCNSRGTFLALALAAGWLLLSARGRCRRFAIAGVVLGLIAGLVMVRDVRIWERFLTTFAAAEERDDNASERVAFWGAAVTMISDYPLGSGGESAFKSDLGAAYIRHAHIGHKAVHQGYFDIAAAWGLQGISLYLFVIFLCMMRARQSTQLAQSLGDHHFSFLGVCIQTSLVTQLAACLFISSLDGEWFFWCFALTTAYARIVESQNMGRVVRTAPAARSNPQLVSA